MSIHIDIELSIVVRPTGKIVTAWCSCVAGANKCCDHVIKLYIKLSMLIAVVLFTILYFNDLWMKSVNK